MKKADQTHMMTALTEAEASLSAGEFPVGCVMVFNNKIIAKGRRVNSFGPTANEFDHAEIRALQNLLKSGFNNIEMSEISVYSTMEPCLMCFSTLLLNGIRRILYAYEDVMGGGTSLNLLSLPNLYKDMEVEIVPGICRQESLALFRAFFTDSKNSYWQESLLARHILEQQ